MTTKWDPATLSEADRDLFERVCMERVDERDGHWLWTGPVATLDKTPVPHFSPRMRLTIGAKRFLFALVVFEHQGRAFSRGKLHAACDEPLCVRPAHHRHFGHDLMPELPTLGNKGKVRCRKGHWLVGPDSDSYTVMRTKNGRVGPQRVCRICHRESDRVRYHDPVNGYAAKKARGEPWPG